MIHALVLLRVLAAEPEPQNPPLTPGEVEGPSEPPPDWSHGLHLTGEWGGARLWLDEHGVTFDIVYAAETFANAAAQEAGQNATFTGHLDVAVTLETQDLGLWPGGKFYVLGQTNHGQGINELVGSTSEISNIEGKPYIQLGEFFFEQTLFKEMITLRLGVPNSRFASCLPRRKVTRSSKSACSKKNSPS